MTQVYLYTLLSLALLAQPIPYDPEHPDLVTFAYDGFAPGINRSIADGDAAKKILQRFGQPRWSYSGKSLDWREPRVINEIHRWQYDGLEIIAVRDDKSKDQRIEIEKITLTSPKYKLKFGLAIGAPKEAFIRRLGPPWKEEPDSIGYWATYYAREEGDHAVSRAGLGIQFDQQHRAKKITWAYGAEFSLMLLMTPILYDPERPELVAFGFDGFDPGINRLLGGENTTERIFQRFGQPRRVESRQEPDRREPGGISEIKTWHYDGLEIITSGWVGYPEQWLKKITLTSPKYKLKFGLAIGAPKEAFIRRLGPPQPSKKKVSDSIGYSAYIYKSEEGAVFVSHSVVNIWFDKEDRAKKITWTYGGH